MTLTFRQVLRQDLTAIEAKHRTDCPSVYIRETDRVTKTN